MSNDPVADRLKRAPLTNAQRADVWDAYAAATDADDFAARAMTLKVPDAIKADLWDLKAGTQTAAPAVPPTAQTPPLPQTTGERIGGKTGAVVDAGIGALKGVGNTLFGMGKVVHDYTPVGRISDAIMPGAFDQRPEELQPLNVAQRIGHTAEQVGEFLLPSSAVMKLGKAGAVGRAVAQTKLQSDSPIDAVVSGGLTAVLPGASAAQRGASALREGAEKNMAQALGATKEWAKSDAAKLAPQMLARGVGGSRAAMLEQASKMADEAGRGIEQAIADAAAAGTTIPGQIARGNIQFAKDALMTKAGNGKMIPIEGAHRSVAKLDKLDQFVAQLGDDIPVEQAQRIKQAWDKIVSKAGLYGPKATSSATDNADAWAIREAAGTFRNLLSQASPDLAAVNKEYAFWGGLRKVLKETEKRTQAQGGGLIAAGMGGAGVTAGALSGDSFADSLEKAALGGLAARQFTKAVQSPWFKTKAAAPFKDALADALASGITARIGHATKRIIAAVPAQAQ